MKLSTATLIAKVSTVLALAAGLSGCGIQEDLQKAKAQEELADGFRLASIGKMKDARDTVDTVIAADPDNSAVYVDQKPDDDTFDITVNEVFGGNGLYQVDEEYLQRAEKKFPDDYHVQFALLNAQQILGETASVQQTATQLITTLEARIAKGNVDGDVLATLTNAYYITGNHPKALATSQKALSIYVADWRVYNQIAYAVADANSKPDLKQALNTANLALNMAQKQGGNYVDINVALVRDTVGWCEYRLGDYKKAEADVNLALEVVPREAGIRYHLGMIYLAEGDKAAAKSELTKALLISPSYADAKTAMEQVKDAPAMPPPPVANADLPDPTTPANAPGA